MDVHFSVGTINLSIHLSCHHKIITEVYVFCFLLKKPTQKTQTENNIQKKNPLPPPPPPPLTK